MSPTKDTPHAPTPPDPTRRRWLRRWPWPLAALGLAGRAAAADGAPSQPDAAAKPPRMPGDTPEHRIVYQINVADPATLEHILNSIGAVVSKYEDNVAVAAVVFGPGIHLLARRPGRPMPAALRERVAGQAKDYGVRFIACGNTMKTLGWTPADLQPFAVVEAVGAASLMELQERGYAYVAW